MFTQGVSKQQVGTQAFAQAVIERLGTQPSTLKPVAYESSGRQSSMSAPSPARTESVKQLVGVDVYLDWTGPAEVLGAKLNPMTVGNLALSVISNRGVQVWPHGMPETFCSDQWRCRFLAKEDETITHAQILSLLQQIDQAGFDFIELENLCIFDGIAGYSSIHG